MEYPISEDFQTPPHICKYMVSMVPEGSVTVLEPTPGIGNIVRALDGYQVTAPKNFFDLHKDSRFDCIVTNPPFSAKWAFGAPEHLLHKHGMRLGYHILTNCMHMSDDIIALMPWFTISDSDVRLRALKSWGLISVTALPRKTFEYARIQTVVLQMKKGFEGETSFKVYDLLKKEKVPLLFE